MRTRTYVVDAVVDGPAGSMVSASCLDDDAQGQPLEAIWEIELGAQVVRDDAWRSITSFDPPRLFTAFINSLRWNCVTATNPQLFQSPFRAGINIHAYQLEPLRKALTMPRVNLFIADDVGLGKTIEAGLIASELLLRRRINEIVVACPPAMLLQWKEELESRFGLVFEILDRVYVERIRQERGFSVNPWKTFPRFLVSQRLLIDETYAAPLRDKLGNLLPGSLLILDEAHHAAPSSGSRYSIDSKITKAVREIAPHFEHRLFLSATPHNGHSSSFSALLEILDEQRFMRGVPVSASNRDEVLVRRLKEDIRSLGEDFPERKVIQIDLPQPGAPPLPEDTPELALARLLDQYRLLREDHAQSRKARAQAGLLFSGLQQRLLSSIEAFARTLSVHRITMERLWSTEKQAPAKAAPPAESESLQQLLISGGSADEMEELAELNESELEGLEDAAVVLATTAAAEGRAQDATQQERDLLRQMALIADQSRSEPDARVQFLVHWIRQNMCPATQLSGEPRLTLDTSWNDLRLLIFTEYEDTRRYLERQLRSAIVGTDHAQRRIAIFSGSTPSDRRELIKQAFQGKPAEHPLRILIATDAAREGLNLQAHCFNLFHFDVPWNPSRLEQRNGRIDRQQQQSPVVNCHYFVYTQRPEDRVLQALVRKSEIIRRELGSSPDVLESRLVNTRSAGIRRAEAQQVATDIETADITPDRRATIKAELDDTLVRQDKLRGQIDGLKKRVEEARKWIGLDMPALRDAVSCSLEMLNAQPLVAEARQDGRPEQFVFPNLDTRQGGDPSWATTLDTLREPSEEGLKGFQWRQSAPLRPVVFESPPGIDDDVVQLHLQHRIVQRLLGRFMAQGFVHHDLSRACLAQSEDSVLRVVLLGRVALYGPRAARLHEEILTVSARWIDPAKRDGPLKPYARDAEARALDILWQSLRTVQKPAGNTGAPALLTSVTRDIEELLPHLKERGETARETAKTALSLRAEQESMAMRSILQKQKESIKKQLDLSASQLPLFQDADERRQFESDVRAWNRRLPRIDVDIEREPARIMDYYSVRTYRVEPIGIVYLLPSGGPS